MMAKTCMMMNARSARDMVPGEWTRGKELSSGRDGCEGSREGDEMSRSVRTFLLTSKLGNLQNRKKVGAPSQSTLFGFSC